MSDDMIIIASKNGEVRIEAKVIKDATVSFDLYYLNNVVRQFHRNNEPLGNFSLAGVNAYYTIIQRELKKFIEKKDFWNTDRILRELREDLSKI